MGNKRKIVTTVGRSGIQQKKLYFAFEQDGATEGQITGSHG